LSCLSVLYEDKDTDAMVKRSATIYADILRLNAKMLLADAKALNALRDPRQAIPTLEQALAATNLGLQVLRGYYNGELDERKRRPASWTRSKSRT